jgi:hypothetical protein
MLLLSSNLNVESDGLAVGVEAPISGSSSAIISVQYTGLETIAVWAFSLSFYRNGLILWKCSCVNSTIPIRKHRYHLAPIVAHKKISGRTISSVVIITLLFGGSINIFRKFVRSMTAFQPLTSSIFTHEYLFSQIFIESVPSGIFKKGNNKGGVNLVCNLTGSHNLIEQ